MSEEAVSSPGGGDHCPQLFLLPLVDDPDGRCPDLPKGVGFLLIAESPRCVTHGLYEVRWGHDSVPPAARAVPKALRRMFSSAKSYPPALALARRDLDKEEGEPITPDELVRRFDAALRKHLAAQPTDAYVLARVVRSGDIDALPGEYLWLTRYDPENRTVVYVSADYFFYPAPVRWFQVSEESLARLPQHKIGPHLIFEPGTIVPMEAKVMPRLRVRPSVPDDDTHFE